MAYEFYVTVEGQKQGRFRGESQREAHRGKFPAFGFSYAVASPRDAATGQASGKRQHGPVTFLKRWGAASPQIFQALATNEVLPSVRFEFLETDPTGEEVVAETIKLVNATVSRFRRYVDRTLPAGAEAPAAEEVELTFQRIELENTGAKTMAVDDWFQKA